MTHLFTKANVIYAAKQVLWFVALFLLMSVLLDYIRRPQISPNLVQADYTSISGTPINFAHHAQQQGDKNQATLVYFWGSWCGVCHRVSPSIHKLQQAGVPVVTVALSSGSDAELKAYLAQKKYSFTTINDDDGNISKAWQVHAVPVIFVVKNGEVIHSMSGFHPSFDIRLRLWLLGLF